MGLNPDSFRTELGVSQNTLPGPQSCDDSNSSSSLILDNSCLYLWEWKIRRRSCCNKDRTTSR